MVTIRACAAALAALSCLAAAPGASAQEPGIKAKVGDAERWVFLANGKEIGTQTARCTAANATRSEWKYEIALQIPSQGRTVAVTMAGVFAVAAGGAPITLTLDADAAGQKQHAEYAFAGKKAVAKLRVGGQSVTREAALEPGATLQVNNLITLASITTQAVRLKPGQVRRAPVFAANALQGITLTFTPEAKTEKLTVAGKAVECVVADVAPIANRFWCNAATGELLKVAAPAQGLVIERR